MESSLLAKGECYRSGLAEVRLGELLTSTHLRPVHTCLLSVVLAVEVNDW